MPVKGPAAMPESLLVCYSTLARFCGFCAGRRTGRFGAAQSQQGGLENHQDLCQSLHPATRSGTEPLAQGAKALSFWLTRELE